MFTPSISLLVFSQQRTLRGHAGKSEKGQRTPAAEHAAPSLKRPASETLHNSGLAAFGIVRNTTLIE
jgi:hypothetical protein